MTHDELLAKINYEIDLELRGMDAESWHAGARTLRAIVELHKPIVVELLDGPGPMCNNCCDGFYPCLTIQIIEHELGKELA